jgi:glycerol-3-phosphate dehydrogenase
VRALAAEQLRTRQFDLLVIGGGIIGAGIAAEAAWTGLAVALVDKGDFGGATSSVSSKLIHGGLRYLRLGDIRTVRESHRERRLLTQTVAPHLVRRLEFLLPLYRHGPYRPATMQTGLIAYAALAHARLHRPIPPFRARELVPGLRLEDLRSCGAYADAVTNDARLCLANVRAAAVAGATVLNYARVVGLQSARRRVSGADLEVDGEEFSVRARVVVNATGPWVDSLRAIEDPRARRSVRLSKGVHVLLARKQLWTTALALPQDKLRVSFVVPWQDMLLLGTTDTLHEENPESVAVTDADIDEVLAEASFAVEPELVTREAIRATFVGLRVLPLGHEGTASARRETVITRGPLGMISVAGGKLTTYRRIAVSTLDTLRGDLGLRGSLGNPVPVPGAVEPIRETARLAREHPEVPESTLAHLVELYGRFAEDVLALGNEDASLLGPLHPDGPDLAAQALYALREEWAVSTEDVLRRRTTMSLRGLGSGEVRQRVQTLIDLEQGGSMVPVSGCL